MTYMHGTMLFTEECAFFLVLLTAGFEISHNTPKTRHVAKLHKIPHHRSRIELNELGRASMFLFKVFPDVRHDLQDSSKAL